MDRGAEREITLYEMTGSFAKTFDVGTMDPFLEVTVQRTKHFTEVHRNGGKQPVWKTSMRFPFVFENTAIQFQAYDKDPDRDQPIGNNTLAISQLKGGRGTARLLLKGVHIGDINFKYQVRKLPEKRLVQIEQVRLEAARDYSQWALELLSDDERDGKEKATVVGGALVWDGYLRVHLGANEQRIRLQVKDHEGGLVSQAVIYLSEFEHTQGNRQEFLIDFKTLQPLGTLSFSYFLINIPLSFTPNLLPSSTLQHLEFTSLTLSSLPPVNLKSPIFLRLFSGNSYFDTSVIPNANPLAFEPISLYNRSNKLTMLLLERRLSEDRLIGRKEIVQGELREGMNEVELRDGGIWQDGMVRFYLKKQTVPVQQLSIFEIQLRVSSKFHLCKIFIKAKIGSLSLRTQTTQHSKRSFLFHNALDFLFHNEQTLEFSAYDEDISTFELIGTANVKILDIKHSTSPYSASLKDKKGAEVGVIQFSIRGEKKVEKELGKAQEEGEGELTGRKARKQAKQKIRHQNKN